MCIGSTVRMYLCTYVLFRQVSKMCECVKKQNKSKSAQWNSKRASERKHCSVCNTHRTHRHSNSDGELNKKKQPSRTSLFGKDDAKRFTVQSLPNFHYVLNELLPLNDSFTVFVLWEYMCFTFESSRFMCVLFIYIFKV